MQFDLVTPAKMVSSMEADYVMVPGEDGSFGVLDGHCLVISTLKAGLLTVKSGTTETNYCVGGGLADVQPTGVTILADDVIKVSDINIKETKQSLAKIQADIKSYTGDESKAVLLKKALKKQAYFEAMLSV